MILYIVIAAASILAAVRVNQTEGYERGTRGYAVRGSSLFLIFLLLFVPAALRQETGNDYLRYVEFFHLASIDSYVPTEPGFNALVKLIYGLCGYENYLLVFAVFAGLTILFFLIAIRQQAEDFLFSFFLFVMFGYYFQSFNTMRYYLALSIALVSMTCYIRKNYAGFLALVIVASLFHKSALIVLVLYPLAAHIWKKWEYVLAFALGGAVLVFHSRVLRILVDLYPTWEDTGDLAAGTEISWVNIAKCAAVLLLLLTVVLSERSNLSVGNDSDHHERPGGRTKESDELLKLDCLREKLHSGTITGRQLRLYVNGTYLGLLIYIFGWFVPEVSRICYYLTFTQIFLLPMLVHRIPAGRKREKKVLTIAVCAAAVIYFAFFLREAYGDTTKILPYKTFLFHDLDATPSGSVMQ